MSERKLFEQRFPMPAGIYWNAISEQYDALPGAAGFDDVEIYHGKWQAWQAARALSGQGVSDLVIAGDRLCRELESWMATEHDMESQGAIAAWKRLRQGVVTPHPEGDGCGERLPNPCPYCGKMPQSNGSPNWRVECSNLDCSVQKPESPQPPVEQEGKGNGRP